MYGNCISTKKKNPKNLKNLFNTGIVYRGECEPLSIPEQNLIHPVFTASSAITPSDIVHTCHTSMPLHARVLCWLISSAWQTPIHSSMPSLYVLSVSSFSLYLSMLAE